MQVIDLLVKEAQIVSTKDGQITTPCAAIAVHDGRILEVAKGLELEKKYRPQKTINAKGCYVFPGFINTHDHLFQVLFKGLGRDLPLWKWLSSTIFKALPFLTEEDIYWAAMAGLMENIRTGVTTTLDFQYCHSHAGQFEAVWQAYEDLGMRGVVARHHFFDDYNGHSKVPLETLDDYLCSVEKIARNVKNPEMVNVAMIAPAMPQLFEKNLYRKGYLREMATLCERENILYTAHMVETDEDDEFIFKATGKKCIPFLEEEGFFSPRCLLAHCVKMRDEDFAVFKKNDVKVSYNPVSNMILGSGVAPIRRFLDEGICVALGIDGSGSNDGQDMLETLKFACLLQKVQHLDAAVLTSLDTLQMATLGGARALGRNDLGEISPGKKADFVLYKPDCLKSAPVVNPINNLVYCSESENIVCTVINGNVVYENRQFSGAKVETVLENLIKCASRIRKIANIES